MFSKFKENGYEFFIMWSSKLVDLIIVKIENKSRELVLV